MAGLARVGAARAARGRAGEPPRDPEAAARRAAEREARVAAGVEDLRRWLRDAVRGGLGAGRLRAWDEWDAFAARLVDAQAPGAASRLRSLGGVAAGRPDGWPERLLTGLGLLHLLCEAYPRADGPVRDDVRALLGFNVAARTCWRARASRPLGRARADRDRAGAPARPAHVAVGARDRPRRRCCSTSRRRARRWSRAPRPGLALEASLAFHPSATPLRALRGRPAGRAGAGPVRRGGAEAALAPSPPRSPPTRGSRSGRSSLAAAVPDGREGGAWSVDDPDGALPLGGPEAARWRLLALSGGRPVSLFGLWDG